MYRTSNPRQTHVDGLIAVLDVASKFPGCLERWAGVETMVVTTVTDQDLLGLLGGVVADTWDVVAYGCVTVGTQR